MNIDFFEEFPTKENLAKTRLINFNSTIYIAAKSLDEFKSIKKKIKNSKLELGYWPILRKSYWISPFSYTSELKKLLNELKQGKNLKIMIDLELPILNKKLFLVNLFSFFKNKKIIKKILKTNNILTAEYSCSNILCQKILEFLGVSYPIKKFHHKKIIMFYTSMIKSRAVKELISKIIIKNSKKYKDNFQVGLGTTAIGILRNEPIISPKNLDNDLNFLKSNRIKTAVIFRLGGINKEYLKIIKKYI